MSDDEANATIPGRCDRCRWDEERERERERERARERERGEKPRADEETLVGERAPGPTSFPLDPPSETVRLSWAFYLRL